MLYVDLPNLAWDTTKLENPTMRVNVTEDLVLSTFFNIRGSARV